MLGMHLQNLSTFFYIHPCTPPLLSLGPGSFMAKTDLIFAFRLMPIHPEDWNFLGIYWQSQYYTDLYLPFGFHSAPFLFNQISDALEWILTHNYGLYHVIHILDDFFIAQLTKIDCLGSFTTHFKVFMSLQVPTITSKTMVPLQIVEFMGTVLGTNHIKARLPEDKLAKIRQLLDSFTNYRSAPLVYLQSLISTLQFTCKVVVPGRTFLQRIINLTCRVKNHFHHICLNKEFSRDLQMWKVFLVQWNGRSCFLDSWVTSSPDLQLYTDTARHTIGFGGFFNGKWFQGRWPPHLLINKPKGISIEWQELFPIVLAWHCGPPPLFWQTPSVLVWQPEHCCHH